MFRGMRLFVCLVTIFCACQALPAQTEPREGIERRIPEVHAITGATVTSDGVSDMLYDGIKNYEPYFKQVKQSSLLIRK